MGLEVLTLMGLVVEMVVTRPLALYSLDTAAQVASEGLRRIVRVALAPVGTMPTETRCLVMELVLVEVLGLTEQTVATLSGAVQLAEVLPIRLTGKREAVHRKVALAVVVAGKLPTPTQEPRKQVVLVGRAAPTQRVVAALGPQQVLTPAQQARR